MLGVVLWLILCLLKMLTSILLLGNAYSWIAGLGTGEVELDVEGTGVSHSAAGDLMMDSTGAGARAAGLGQGNGLSFARGARMHKTGSGRVGSKIRLGPVAKIEQYVMNNTGRKDKDWE